METLSKLLVLVFVLLFFLNCSTKESNPNAIVILSELEAAISFDENCTSTINFEDFDHNVYGYRADADFGVPSVQTGGHSTLDETTDLGFNMFFDPNDTERTNYTIDGSSGQVGTAYVFYIVGGVQYISSDTNPSNLVIDNLVLNDNGQVEILVASFNNVEVVNNSNVSDVRCVNAYKMRFYR
ncbi:hypothetical protein [Hyunsoonleella rubra]|uniref:Uncharacterized protein n=1 Tax=Hyunsoonleella rubra TaxID=1737062 RepID=A0ABW5TE84_9FLAO